MNKWIKEQMSFQSRLDYVTDKVAHRARLEACRRNYGEKLRARQQERDHLTRTAHICGSEPFEFSRRTPSHAHRVSMTRIESAIAECYGLDSYKLAF